MNQASEQGVLNAQYNAAVEAQQTAVAQRAPHVLLKPGIAKDGNKWSALYGDNIQEGVCGFGDTPAEAMEDFDKNWLNQTIDKTIFKIEGVGQWNVEDQDQKEEMLRPGDPRCDYRGP